MKYISFLYLGEENVYIYSTSTNNYDELVTSASSCNGVWTVIYEFESDEHYGYVSGKKYQHKVTIKGLNTKSYLSPTPMNRVINMPTPMNHKADIFTHRWMWMN
jgi:hypothetical protein